MALLTDFDWQSKYDPDEGSLIEQFYLRALSCAQRYDRTTGYFTATALAIAARGIEGLVLNQGGCAWWSAARWISQRWQPSSRASQSADTVEAKLMSMPLSGGSLHEKGSARTAVLDGGQRLSGNQGRCTLRPRP